MKRVLVLMMIAGCTDDPIESYGETQAYAVAYNAVAYNQITTNAISANRVATDELIAMPLATGIVSSGAGLTGSFASPAVRLGLEDPNATTFMRYLVQCALAPDQQITWRSVAGIRFQETFTGAYGLCPSWYAGLPDTDCRQRVSGCILARNNAFGYSVQFSLRGQSVTAPLPLSPTVAPHDKVPATKPPQTVPSLEACPFPILGNRDCGWVVDKVGICNPGETVVVGAGAQAQCQWGESLGTAGTPGEMLRVCPGHVACDWTNSLHTLADCPPSVTRFKFTCPADEEHKGQYSVMRAAFDSTQVPTGVVASTQTSLYWALRPDVWATMPSCFASWTTDCEIELQKLSRYAAPESRVFRWLEGSFYGDIFGSSNLHEAKPEVIVRIVPPPLKKGRPTVVISTRFHDGGPDVDDGGAGSSKFVGVVFPSMYACASPNWAHDEAYMARRVCAGPADGSPDGNYVRDCAAKYVGVCRVLEHSELSKCVSWEGLGKEHLATCYDDVGGEWPWPITSALAGPTAAIPDPFASQGIIGAPIVSF